MQTKWLSGDKKLKKNTQMPVCFLSVAPPLWVGTDDLLCVALCFLLSPPCCSGSNSWQNSSTTARPPARLPLRFDWVSPTFLTAAILTGSSRASTGVTTNNLHPAAAWRGSFSLYSSLCFMPVPQFIHCLTHLFLLSCCSHGWTDKRRKTL